MDQHSGNTAGAAPLLADHPALDLLNTEARANGSAVDFWQADGDVLDWLRRCGADADGRAAPAGLLQAARSLRSCVRGLVEQRKLGGPVDPAELNRILQAFTTYPVLEATGTGALRLARRSAGTTAAALLGPVAEAAASLLAEGDFSLVRQCEHPDCVLWFYDRTKGHKRRWCSMTLCGNRYKAAQFRKRAGAAAA